DTCDPIVGCLSTALPNGTLCADQTVCNGIETCQSGACTAGTALNCDDSNLCTSDACDPILGCISTPLINGTPCSDGNVCNGNEVCQGGVCPAGAALNCTDNNPCTTDACDPVLSCVYTPVLDGTACSDGNVCNGAETCLAGTCIAGAPLVCDDLNPCTVDTCDPIAGCVFTPNTGLPCEDGLFCTVGDTCAPGPRAPPGTAPRPPTSATSASATRRRPPVRGSRRTRDSPASPTPA